MLGREPGRVGEPVGGRHVVRERDGPLTRIVVALPWGQAHPDHVEPGAGPELGEGSRHVGGGSGEDDSDGPGQGEQGCAQDGRGPDQRGGAGRPPPGTQWSRRPGWRSQARTDAAHMARSTSVTAEVLDRGTGPRSGVLSVRRSSGHTITASGAHRQRSRRADLVEHAGAGHDDGGADAGPERQSPPAAPGPDRRLRHGCRPRDQVGHQHRRSDGLDGRAGRGGHQMCHSRRDGLSHEWCSSPWTR